MKSKLEQIVSISLAAILLAVATYLGLTQFGGKTPIQAGNAMCWIFFTLGWAAHAAATYRICPLCAAYAIIFSTGSVNCAVMDIPIQLALQVIAAALLFASPFTSLSLAALMVAVCVSGLATD